MNSENEPDESLFIPGTAPCSEKSTIDEIKQRFDKDVARFSNLETGQTATIDARLCMSLIADAAATSTPHASNILDLGCGAGNYSLMLLDRLPDCNVTLVDLSRNMLFKAEERITPLCRGKVTTLQSDLKALDWEDSKYDIIVAAAVLHHLRDEQEWEQVFNRIYTALQPGGSFWVFDLVECSISAIRIMMWQRYGDYLTQLKDEKYRDNVFSYIDQEDTPRSVMYQIQLMKQTGWKEIEILHKNCCFVAFGGMKE